MLMYNGWSLLCVLFALSILLYYIYRNAVRRRNEHFKKYTSSTPIVISATTSPTRIFDSLNLFKSMIDEGIIPHGINIEVNIPREFGRTREKYPDVSSPSERIHLYKGMEDEGPATKLLPTLDRYAGTRTLIITIDDDTKYAHGVFNVHNALADLYNLNCATCFSAIGHNSALHAHPLLQRILEERATFPKEKQDGVPHTFSYFIEGFGSVGYPAHIVDASKIRKYLKGCRNSDDFAMSFALSELKIPILLVKTDDIFNENVVQQQDFGFQQDALHNIQSHFNSYEKCAILHHRLLNEFNKVNYINPKSLAEIADNPPRITSKGAPLFRGDDFSSDNRVIYISTKYIPDFVENVLPKLGYFVLLTGDEDTSPSHYWKTRDILDSPKLIRWYAQNLDIKHEKMNHLPIGLDYHTIYFSPSHAWSSVRKTPKEQEDDLLRKREELPLSKDRDCSAYTTAHLNHTDNSPYHSHKYERRKMYRTLKNRKGVVFEEDSISRNQTWDNHGKHLFILSPPGKGLDCHRTWEALALGNIPIVLSTELNDMYEGLPVVIVSNWDDVSLENMKRWRDNLLPLISQNYPILNMNHWKKKILEIN